MARLNRICIYASDVQIIFGMSYSHAVGLLARIRKQLGKGPRDYVTMGEFAQATKLPLEEVKNALR